VNTGADWRGCANRGGSPHRNGGRRPAIHFPQNLAKKRLCAGATHERGHQRRQEDKQPYRNAVQPGSAPGKKLKQSIGHYQIPHPPLRILSHCDQDTMKRFTKAAGVPARAPTDGAWPRLLQRTDAPKKSRGHGAGENHRSRRKTSLFKRISI
jgi:hypothetical protein